MMGVFVMSKRNPVSFEIKIQAVRRCLQHESNPNHEANNWGSVKTRLAIG